MSVKISDRTEGPGWLSLNWLSRCRSVIRAAIEHAALGEDIT